jgi:hypothetical protein
MLPNDEKEQARLDLLHHVFRLCLDGGVCHSQDKLQNPQKILDVGTGTGIWAIDSESSSFSSFVFSSLSSRVQLSIQWPMSTRPQR